MPRGGARVVSGPPPDPNALRRDRPGDKASWTTLPAEGRAGKPPAWPTFGFRLVDRTGEKGGVIKDVTDLLKSMLKTMMLAGDRRYLSQRHQGRVVDLDLTGLKVTATDFGLSNEIKDQLYMRGYQAAKAFFLEQWSWKKHLETRGFPTA